VTNRVLCKGAAFTQPETHLYEWVEMHIPITCTIAYHLQTEWKFLRRILFNAWPCLDLISLNQNLAEMPSEISCYAKDSTRVGFYIAIHQQICPESHSIEDLISNFWWILLGQWYRGDYLAETYFRTDRQFFHACKQHVLKIWLY
jgi:hypothetical protein